MVFLISSFFSLRLSQVVSLELNAAELPLPISEVVLRIGAVPSKKEAKRLVEGTILLARFQHVRSNDFLKIRWWFGVGWWRCRGPSLQSCCWRLQARAQRAQGGQEKGVCRSIKRCSIDVRKYKRTAVIISTIYQQGLSVLRVGKKRAFVVRLKDAA